MRKRIWIVALVACGVVVQATAALADNSTYPAGPLVSDSFQVSDVPSVAVQPVPALPGPPIVQSGPLEGGRGYSNTTDCATTTDSNAQLPLLPAAPAAVGAVPPCNGCCDRLVESTIYARIDSFDWSEGNNVMEEDGALATVGFQYRSGPHRFRTELFEGGGDFEERYFQDHLSSTVDFFGTTDEYEYMYDPVILPHDTVFLGIGTKLWDMEVPEFISRNGHTFSGRTETWWTFYPYVGIETKRTVKRNKQIYGSARIGLTAFTFEEISYNGVKQNPGPGLFLQSEIGYRGEHWLFALYTELLDWGESQKVRADNRFWQQPDASLLLLGLKTGYSF